MSSPPDQKSVQPTTNGIGWGWLKGWVTVMVTIVGAIFLTSMSLSLIYRDRELKKGRQVMIKLSELSSRGAPVDDETHSEWYKSRTSSKNTHQWLEVFDELNSKEFREKSRGIAYFDLKAESTTRNYFTGKWTGETRWRELYRDTAELRARIRELVQDNEPVYLPIQFQSIETLMGEVQTFRSVYRLLALEADIHLADKNLSEFVSTIETNARFTEITSNQPFLIGTLVWTAGRGMLFEKVRAGLELDVWDVTHLSQIREAVKSLKRPIDDWSNIVQSERALGLPIFFDVRLVAKKRISKRTNAPPGDALHYLEFMEQLEKISTEDWQHAIQEANQVELDLTKLTKEAGILGVREWMITGLVFPAAGAAVTALVRDAVLQRQVELAIELRLYQQRHGEFPESLQELVEDGVPQEGLLTIGDHRYGYQREEKGAALWGVIWSTKLSSTALEVPAERPHLSIELEEHQFDPIRNALIEFQISEQKPSEQR